MNKEEGNKQLPFIDRFSQGQLDVMKIVFMIGLIITMIILGVVIFKYGSAIQSNPCDFCDCKAIGNIRW